VTSWVDLTGLRPEPAPGKPIDVLTGKLWPWLYQIEIDTETP